MTTEELLIHELAEKAGVSVRTIRYYIEEGLLPPPTYEGKYSFYSTAYLDRLELIRRLKDSYLPLREIREIMSSLSDEDVRLRLMQTQPSSKFSAQPPAPRAIAKPGARALEYIDRVMDDQNKYRMKGNQEKPLNTFQQALPQADEMQLNQAAPSPNQANEEIWQRISLAPGVELHVRRPLDPNLDSRLGQLIYYARRIFHNKS